MRVGRWISMCATLVLPLFTKGNVTNICDDCVGKEDQLIKIDNSNWGAIGDRGWWSLTYFGGLESLIF